MISYWSLLWDALWGALRERWKVLRRNPDAGYSTETVVVTAGLVVLALVVLAIIVTAVTNKANSIVM